MKAKPTLLVLGAILLSAPLCGQNLDEIIAKSIEARGGREKIMAVDSVRITGQMKVSESLTAPFSWEWKRPGSFRVEFTLQGKLGIQAFDGESAWMQVPFAGKPDPERLSEDVTRAMSSEADFDGHLLDYEEKGHKVDLLPEGEVEGRKVHRILVTLDTGNLFLYSLDQETSLVVQTETRTFLGEAQVESVNQYSDYREVNGLNFPHTMEAKLKTQPEGRTMTVERIEINPEIDDTRFAFPGEDLP